MQPKPPRIVSIAGPSGSGKTAIARGLVEALGPDRAVRLSLDAYYRDLADLDVALREQVNFDAPQSIDWDRFRHDLAVWRTGAAIRAPRYDFATHTRSPETTCVPPRAVLVVDGLWLLDETAEGDRGLGVYIDTPWDVCLGRRIDRDVAERGRSKESVERQWRDTVRPMAEAHVVPCRDKADLVIDGTRPIDENVAVIIRRMDEMV